MKRSLITLLTGGLVLALGFNTGMAQEEEEPEVATPIEIFTCNYNEGMGYEQLDAPVASFNRWADRQGLNDYSAWTLVPYYASENQEFDVLWLGGSPSAQSLGRAQDLWLTTGGKVQEEFNEVAPCGGHSNFAALQFKEPPEREDPSNIVVSFSDCKITEGMNFGDVAPALGGWAEYKSGNNSTAGIWVLFPAYGGGGEEFDFKYVEAFNNLEEQGIDWDQYSKEGWQKADELFAGKLSCDSSRVYLAKNRRMAEDDDE